MAQYMLHNLQRYKDDSIGHKLFFEDMCRYYSRPKNKYSKRALAKIMDEYDEHQRKAKLLKCKNQYCTKKYMRSQGKRRKGGDCKSKIQNLKDELKQKCIDEEKSRGYAC